MHGVISRAGNKGQSQPKTITSLGVASTKPQTRFQGTSLGVPKTRFRQIPDSDMTTELTEKSKKTPYKTSPTHHPAASLSVTVYAR
jgi:hypothetical protein